VIEKILEHLGLQAHPPPRAPAREPVVHHAGCAAPAFKRTPSQVHHRPPGIAPVAVLSHAAVER
jgi:hypothetical protein